MEQSAQENPQYGEKFENIVELDPNEFHLKYNKLGKSRYISSNGPCVSPITTDEKWYTWGVYNCVSVSVVKANGESKLMHSLPYLAEHFLEKFLEDLFDEDTHFQSILVAGGAEEGKRVAESLYSHLKGIADTVTWVKPPDSYSSVSVGIDPATKRLEYAINRYANGRKLT